MSDHDLKRYVVTFRYQERGLGDLQALNSAMVNGGYSTTLHDAGGHPPQPGAHNLWLVWGLGGEGAGGHPPRAAGGGGW
ncbi:type V toxin-antitoxin system endoribonuclease antitoxin GhoS [Pantoea dispersa]|uniref:type V toxin-antitoxin system endoribonuclease antitoxin GhoS n=1 Tax=Pantoea dispersa TaxID=59814 RepID=UPI000735FAC1|nr:type V toxin-antitoxin system endoribonuclease antitoxin GhoS [Pantoea dispersa]KTS44590.1 hypothetical protein NS380_21920 [Pantoea dispersa]